MERIIYASAYQCCQPRRAARTGTRTAKAWRINFFNSGTLNALKTAGIEAESVSTLTHFPEILSGRVKTLHPAILGGILARRDLPEHIHELQAQHIVPIDIVVVNLYPFAETIA